MTSIFGGREYNTFSWLATWNKFRDHDLSYVIWLIKQEIKKSDGVGSMHQPGDRNPNSKHAVKDEQHFNLPQDLSGS